MPIWPEVSPARRDSPPCILLPTFRQIVCKPSRKKLFDRSPNESQSRGMHRCKAPESCELSPGKLNHYGNFALGRIAPDTQGLANHPVKQALTQNKIGS